jgi:hypothetical protein
MARPRLVLLIALLPAWPLACAAADAEHTPKFAWPNDLTCRVEQRTSMTGVPDAVLRFTLRASEAPDDGRFIEATLGELQSMDTADAAFQLATRLPPFHVGLQGSLLGIRDATQAKAQIRAALLAAMPAPPGDDNLERLVNQLSAPALLENQVSNFWNAAVEQWVGRELGAKPITGEAETTIPGSIVPLKVTATMERPRHLPCTRGGKSLQCAELISTEVPEAGNLRAVMRAILGADGAAEMDKIGSMSLHTRTVTLAEPDTLIPHQVSVTRTIGIQRTGETAPRETVERQSWAFDCD